MRRCFLLTEFGRVARKTRQGKGERRDSVRSGMEWYVAGKAGRGWVIWGSWWPWKGVGVLFARQQESYYFF